MWLYDGLEVTNTVNLYEYPIDGSKVVGKVTSKDSIKTSYSYGVWLVWYYVEVDGTKGWIKGQDSFIEKQEIQVVLLNDAYVYDEPDGKKTGTKVSKDKFLTLYSIKNTVKNNKTLVYGLYNYNGKNVWILISGDNTNYATKLATDNFENEIATIVDGDKIYKSANSKAGSWILLVLKLRLQMRINLRIMKVMILTMLCLMLELDGF